jgi:hypothetical protein
MKLSCHNQIALAGLFFFCLSAGSLRANVYATDIRLNGSLGSQVILPGSNLTISYILNQAATGGVWVRICSGTNVIKTLASTNGAAGTNAGLNSVTLDDVTNLAEGAYSVSITAASTGYDTWTNITDDGANYSIASPRGISVNQNTNSPYYGRVYVGNAYDNGNGAPGDQVGLFKYNADGSAADEGGFSTGGWGWAGDKYSPWKMAIGPDDRLYVDDFTLAGQGIVLSFDPAIDTNSLRNVITPANYPPAYPDVALSGLAFSATGTNTQIWMTDANPQSGGNPYGSAGIIGWQMTGDGAAAANDTGTSIVPVDSYILTEAPYDVAVDSNGFIYTIQFLTTFNPNYALITFPPYEGEPEMTADWVISWYPSLLQASGVAVDPTGTYAALAVVGACDAESACGGLYLYSAANVDFIADLDQTGGDPYYDVAWDNVGNLYALDGVPSNAVWRVYSPPGTNQATTVAVPVIQAYAALLPPSLGNPLMDPGVMHFTLTGQSNVTYIIQRSADFSNWIPVATNCSSNVSRFVHVPMCGQQNFYRAVTAP